MNLITKTYQDNAPALKRRDHWVGVLLTILLLGFAYYMGTRGRE